MSVLLCSEVDSTRLAELIGRYGLQLHWVEDGQPIPGSWFGDPEAGLIGNGLYVRSDTPVHSALHETCHYICMDADRRSTLHTNAGGGYDEENGVCYLQTLLADEIPGYGRARSFTDLDEWGYTFRLGSSRAWFEQDADDALAWLVQHGVLDQSKQPTWRVRV